MIDPAALREALAAALDIDDPWENWTNDQFDLVIAAGRRQLALTSESCGTCEGSGEQWSLLVAWPTRCPTCHGRGYLYPAETVEKLAQALYETFYLRGERLDPLIQDQMRIQAIAVLDALAAAQRSSE